MKNSITRTCGFKKACSPQTLCCIPVPENLEQLPMEFSDFGDWLAECWLEDLLLCMCCSIRVSWFVAQENVHCCLGKI